MPARLRTRYSRPIENEFDQSAERRRAQLNAMEGPTDRGSTEREPTDLDLPQHWGNHNPGQRNDLMLPVTDAAPARTTPAVDAPPAAPPTPARSGSGGRGQSYFTGYDFGQDAANRDPSKSAKYAFSDFAGDAAAVDGRWKQKATADDWFNEHVRPGLEAAGYTVHDVQGDKAFISTRENPEGTWIDFVQGADGENPLLAWQDESYGGDPMAGGARGGGGGVTSLLDPSAVGGDALAQIMAEIQALARGGQSPTQRDAILAMLGVR